MKNHYSAGIVAILILAAISIAITTTLIEQEVKAPTGPRRAPPLVIDDNVYVAWWTDKINLSNTNASESERVELDSNGESIAVTWWETNQTDEIPVMRISNDNGETFGPVLRLATNGTIGEATEEEE